MNASSPGALLLRIYKNCTGHSSPNPPLPLLCLHRACPLVRLRPRRSWGNQTTAQSGDSSRRSTTRSSSMQLISRAIGPKEGRTSKRRFATSRLRVSRRTCGHGGNTDKSPLKVHRIQGDITDAVPRRGAWPGNRLSGTSPTRPCSSSHTPPNTTTPLRLTGTRWPAVPVRSRPSPLPPPETPRTEIPESLRTRPPPPPHALPGAGSRIRRRPRRLR